MKFAFFDKGKTEHFWQPNPLEPSNGSVIVVSITFQCWFAVGESDW